MTPRTTLMLGGARSGKSRRAQALAQSLGARRAIIVTAEAFDEEMRERIARHRADRDASWRTVDAAIDLPTALDGIGRDVADVVLIDCLTVWLSNVLLAEHDVDGATDALLAALARAVVPVVLVSNEVGHGLVPGTPLGRRFRDAQGRLNQRVADACERVELIVAGQSLVIRDEPRPSSNAGWPTAERRTPATRETARARADGPPSAGAMTVIGVDFTSTPTRRKPIVRVSGACENGVLHVTDLATLPCLADLDTLLRRPGPWIAGLDFPFGQSRRFVQNSGWPLDWAAYVLHAAALTRVEFRAVLDAYREPRPAGDREHRRVTDAAAGAISPQKLYGVPVALMFHEGAPRLCASGVHVPGLQYGDPDRIVVEAYPGVLARHLLGRRPYKNDMPAKQNEKQRSARRSLLHGLRDGQLVDSHGIRVELAETIDASAFIDDPTGDGLDALLCAVQAAWAWTRREDGYGMPPGTDPLEGWIAEPTLASPDGALDGDQASVRT